MHPTSSVRTIDRNLHPGNLDRTIERIDEFAASM